MCPCFTVQLGLTALNISTFKLNAHRFLKMEDRYIQVEIAAAAAQQQHHDRGDRSINTNGHPKDKKHTLSYKGIDNEPKAYAALNHTIRLPVTKTIPLGIT